MDGNELSFVDQLKQAALSLGTTLGENYIAAEFPAPVAAHDTNTQTTSGAGKSTDTVTKQPDYFGFVEKNQGGLLLFFGGMLVVGLVLKFAVK